MSNDDGLMMDMMLMIIIMLMDMTLMVMMTAIRWLILVMMIMIMMDMSAYAGDESDENSAYEVATVNHNTSQHTVSVQYQYRPLGKGSPTQGSVPHLKIGNAKFRSETALSKCHHQIRRHCKFLCHLSQSDQFWGSQISGTP